jgi:hypothetical protein
MASSRTNFTEGCKIRTKGKVVTAHATKAEVKLHSFFIWALHQGGTNFKKSSRYLNILCARSVVGSKSESKDTQGAPVQNLVSRNLFSPAFTRRRMVNFTLPAPLPQ